MKSIFTTFVAGIIACTLFSGCDSLIYDYEGDCEPRYHVRFVYDMNMKFVDAFSAEVESVTLYVVDDTTGKIVLTKSEAGEALHNDGYMMDIDVNPGRYTLLAWAGEGHTSSFKVSEGDTYTDLICALERTYSDSGNAESKDLLNNLYHGRLEATEFVEEQGDHIYTVPLIKDTNSITVVLQHLSGEPVDVSKFQFTIRDNNGLMNWDNTLLPDEEITYHAWEKRQGTASTIDNPDNDNLDSRAQTSVSVAIAELSIARLVYGQQTRLDIHNTDGELVASIPLIDYALMVKSAVYKDMSEQEYLDREDNYSLVMFLDERDKWYDFFIYINSWRIVLQSTEL